MKNTSTKRLLMVTVCVLFTYTNASGMRNDPIYDYRPIQNMLAFGMLDSQNWANISQDHKELIAAYVLMYTEVIGMKSIAFCEDAANNPYIQLAWRACLAEITDVVADTSSWSATSAVLSGPACKDKVTELTVMIEPFLEHSCKWRDFAKHLIQFPNLKTLIFGGFGPDDDDFRAHHELDIKFANAFTVLPNTLTTVEFEDYFPRPEAYGVLMALGFSYNLDDEEFRRTNPFNSEALF